MILNTVLLTFPGYPGMTNSTINPTRLVNPIQAWLELNLRHPAVYFSSLSFILGFLLVQRTRLAFERYWNARNQLATMTVGLLYSGWRCVCVCVKRGGRKRGGGTVNHVLPCAVNHSDPFLPFLHTHPHPCCRQP